MPQTTTPTQRKGRPLTGGHVPQRANSENEYSQVPLSPFAAFFRQPNKLVYPANTGDGTYVPIPKNNNIKKASFNKARSNAARNALSYQFNDAHPDIRPTSPSVNQETGRYGGSPLDGLFGWHRADAALALIRSTPVVRPGVRGPANHPVFDYTTISGVGFAGASVNPETPAGPYAPDAGINVGGQ